MTLRFYALLALFCTITMAATAQPTLSSPLSMPPICDSTLFTYSPTSATPGTTFEWRRYVIPGIAIPPAIGTDGISEVLNNVTNVPVTVTYVYTLTAGSTTNIQNVTVVVEPQAVLISPLTASLCSGTLFHYVPTSLTPGVTYTWTRNFISGISDAAAIGTGIISETLHDTTHAWVVVPYTFTLVIGGCPDTQTIHVTVTVPLPGIITGAANVCTDSVISLADTASGGIWNATNGLAAVSASGVVTGVSPGIDTIVYTVFNTCGYASVQHLVSVNACTISGVNTVGEPVPLFAVYPNPVKTIFTVHAGSAGVFILYTADGREMAKYNVATGYNTLSIPTGMTAGMYMCRFNGDDGNGEIIKLVYEP